MNTCSRSGKNSPAKSSQIQNQGVLLLLGNKGLIDRSVEDLRGGVPTFMKRRSSGGGGGDTWIIIEAGELLVDRSNSPVAGEALLALCFCHSGNSTPCYSGGTSSTADTQRVVVPILHYRGRKNVAVMPKMKARTWAQKKEQLSVYHQGCVEIKLARVSNHKQITCGEKQNYFSRRRFSGWVQKAKKTSISTSKQYTCLIL